MHVHQVLHFQRIYCHFCITWTFKFFVLMFSKVGTSGCSYSSEHLSTFLPCLIYWQLTDFNRVCCIYGWIRLEWLFVVQLTKQTFKMQCCRLAGIWLSVLQHCNKVMSTLHVSSFSCVINSQDASSCPLPTVLLGSYRVTFSIWFGAWFPCFTELKVQKGS